MVMIADGVILKRDFIKQDRIYFDDSGVVGVTDRIQQQHKGHIVTKIKKKLSVW